MKNNNISTKVKFNGQTMDGLVAVFPVEDKYWVTIAVSVEAKPNVGTTMSVQLQDLKRLLAL